MQQQLNRLKWLKVIGTKASFYLPVFFLMAARLVSQQSQTVYYSLAKNSAPGGLITIQNNIGQTQHQLVVISKDAPGHTCNTYFSASLFGSYDGVNYTNLPQVLQLYQNPNTPTYRSSRAYIGQGAYPFLAAQLTPDVTNCLYDISYTGILFPQTLLPLQQVIQGANTLGGLSTYVTVGQAFTSGDTAIIPQVSGSVVVPYGIQICNHTAGTTVELKNGAGQVLQAWPSLAANACISPILTSNLPVYPQLLPGTITNTWPNGYIYRRAITLPGTLISSGTLTDFPAGISGTLSDIRTAANGGQVQNATTCCVSAITAPADLIFTSDSDGAVPLQWEFETYSATTGAFNVWVKMPTITAGTPTTIYMFYNKPSVVTYQATYTSTWDANFVAVYHLSVPTSSAFDSTTNGFTGTNTNVVQTQMVFDGAAGNVLFPPPDQVVMNMGTHAALQPTTALTMDLWFTAGAHYSTSALSWLAGQNTGSQNGYGLYGYLPFYGAPVCSIAQSPPGNYAARYNALKAAFTTNYLGCTYTTATHTIIAYQDGAQVSTTPAIGPINYTVGGTFYAYSNPQITNPPNSQTDGAFDEIRVSNTARPANYFQANYNMLNGGMGATIGSAQITNASGLTLNVSQNATLDVNINYRLE